MTFRTIALAAALAVTPFAAFAAPWTIDKSHTQVTFSVSHFGFSETNGIFRAFDAEVDFDPENIAATQVSFVIDAASIDTFWTARDEHVRTADFLDVANHPQITFVSTSVVQTGDTTADLTGDLTIRGVTKPVTFQATLNNLGPNPFNPEVQVAGFKLVGQIDRTEFGVDYGAPAIGAIIPVEIDLEMSPSEASPS